MKPNRKAVYDKYNGRCAYCGCELQKGWHVDEILPVVRSQRYIKDGNGDRVWCEVKREYKIERYMEFPERMTLDNQNPACASCNIMKSSEPLESFRNKISAFITSLNEYSTQYKFAKRYGLVMETVKPIVFYFEQVSSPPQSSDPV